MKLERLCGNSIVFRNHKGWINCIIMCKKFQLGIPSHIVNHDREMKTQRLCVWKATLKKSPLMWHVNYSKSGVMSNNWEQKSLEITETHSKSSLLSWIDMEQYFQLLDNIEIKNSMRTITLIYLLWVLCKIGRFSNTWMLKESRLCHSIDEPQFGRREWISGTFVWDTTTKYILTCIS